MGEPPLSAQTSGDTQTVLDDKLSQTSEVGFLGVACSRLRCSGFGGLWWPPSLLFSRAPGKTVLLTQFTDPRASWY